MKHFYLLLFFSTFICFSQNPGDIIITEIMINPAAVSDVNGEWFEVYNTTSSPIDMNGWTVRDLGTNNHVINASLVVPAGGFAVVARTASATNGGATADYIITGGFGVANGDDEIIIETPGAVIIDQVNYDGGPAFPNPNGSSINLDPTRFDATDNDNGANWCPSTIAFGAGDNGSPGSANESCATLTIEDNGFATFSLYPNPTSTGFVTIRSTLNGALNISVFDVLGKQVINRTLNGERLNVSSLNTGIYVMRISQNNNSVTKKLVIR